MCQCKLFHSIKPLFANKPVMLVMNKIDVTRLDDLTPENRALVDEIITAPGVLNVQVSCYTDEGWELRGNTGQTLSENVTYGAREWIVCVILPVCNVMVQRSCAHDLAMETTRYCATAFVKVRSVDACLTCYCANVQFRSTYASNTL